MIRNRIQTALPILLLLIISLFHHDVSAQSPTQMPKSLLIDNADILTPAQRAVILDSLRHFAATTSNGIMVVTTNDLNGQTPMEAAYEIGQKAGLGTKEHDNGIVILVKPKIGNSRGEMAIAVGYGLEGALPDATCKMIIMRQAIPEFKRNDYYAGIMNTLNTVMPIARGEYSIDNYGNDDDDIAPLIGAFAILIGMLIIFFVIGRENKNNDNDQNYRGGGGRTFGAPIIFPMGGFGHGSSGGSGFGGFGGFGGGSFGGGGASGSW